MTSMHLNQLRKWVYSSPPVEWGINQVRELLIGAVRQGPVPQHIAFVMDGNRRFARTHQIETAEGHNLGFESLAKILEVCYKLGVKVITIYAFSIENFKRSKYEVDTLMDLFKVKLAQISQHGELLDRYGASIRVLGQRDLVRPDILEACNNAVEMSRDNGDAILNICFPYTSRDEITTAIRSTVAELSTPLPAPKRPFSERRIAQKLRSRNLTSSPTPPHRSISPSIAEATGTDVEDSLSSSATLHPDSTTSSDSADPNEPSYPDPESITAATVEGHLFTADNPPLDLLIRTSGVNRLSDFMLWQCHNDTQLRFLDCFWPEFSLRHFLPVLIEWQWQRKKNGDDKEGAVIKARPKVAKAY